MIERGDLLPDLSLLSPAGEPVSLRSHIGRPLVLYFYPKADTAGCAREAQDFTALLPEFAAAGTAMLGVSRDAPLKLARFAAKYELAVPLAADAEGVVTEAFGVWVEKSMYGKTFWGIERATFLFDAEGRAARIWRRVKVPGHAAAVLEAVRALA